MKNTFKTKKGFTLVELIVVIAIMAILAGISVPSVLNYINNYKKVGAKNNTESIFRIAVAAIPQYNLETKGDNSLTNAQRTAKMVDQIKARASSSEYDIESFPSTSVGSPSDKSVILVEVVGSKVYVAFLGKGWTYSGSSLSNITIKDENGKDCKFCYCQNIW